jgi:hypothetical protein
MFNLLHLYTTSELQTLLYKIRKDLGYARGNTQDEEIDLSLSSSEEEAKGNS